LQEIADQSGAQVWGSLATDWLQIFTLIAQSRAVLGNDTGLLHAAAALQRPVVGVFGGGTWPRFIPAGPGAVVVNPLPCFGCQWDCAFGDAPCISALAPAEVQQALAHVLDGPTQSECAVIETHHFLPETTALMGLAAARYWELGAELNRRERNFQDTVRLAAAKDPEIQSLKSEADGKDREIEALKAETDSKDREIAALKRETDRKDREIVALTATANESDRRAGAIETEAAARAAVIERLDRACKELQKTCDERAELIHRLDRHIAAGKPPA